jgi:ribonuclease HII
LAKRRRSKRGSRVRSKDRLLAHEKRLRSEGYSLIAGVDEAGVGPLAGPVVAGAVMLRRFDFKELIDDSKRLSEARRERAYREIMRKASVGVGIVDPRVIDKLNIYKATRLAMERAVACLKTPPQYILIDGRIKLSVPGPQESIIRGDSKSISIAAASIIAKVTRDNLMRELDSLYPHYDFKTHKGYPTTRHKAALARHGPSPAHRFTYSPVRKSV